uniref:Ig-like domain-containing protein n=1 Tax=Hucho hucho TaxID=62062 RepID=A0A4W5JYR7_9TELE
MAFLFYVGGMVNNSTIFLLFISIVVVTTVNRNVCALKGTSVDISCTYTYPNGPQISKAFWSNKWGPRGEPEDLSQDPKYSEKLDPTSVSEGESAILRCRTKCTLGPNTAFICPSGKIVEGSSVTLTCNSDANPPVQNYTWLKRNITSPKASGQSYTITKISSEDSGEYYCEARNILGGENFSLIPIHIAVAFIWAPVVGVGVGAVWAAGALVFTYCMLERRFRGRDHSITDTHTPEPVDPVYPAEGSDSHWAGSVVTQPSAQTTVPRLQLPAVPAQGFPST